MKKMIMIAVLAFLASCTVGRVTTPEGVSITYADFHPTGNAVEADARWVGVGSLKMSRQSEGAENVISAAGDIVDSITSPVSVVAPQ